MLHSIRGRLILSYTALTLLTILLIGVVALSLASRYMAGRERDALALNAAAVARMARPLLTAPLSSSRLQQLAITASFLTNSEVQILNSDRQALADSRVEPTELESARATLRLFETRQRIEGDSERGGLIGPFIIVPGAGHPRGMFALGGDNDGRYIAASIIVERRPGMWGDRLIFEESADTPNETEAQPVSAEGDRSFRSFWQVVFGDGGETARLAAAGPTVAMPIQQDNRIVGYVQMTNRYPLSAEPLLAIRRSLLVAGLGAVLVAVLLGFLISRTLTAPLMALAGATQRMEGGDLAVRAPEAVGEIGDLSRRFNRMAVRLQATFADLAAERDALRRFIADASHELRTPLTALRQFVEILPGQAGHDPETRSEFLAESQRQLERLQWITGHLLDLSRLDGGVASLDLARHDAANLLEGALAPFRSLATGARIDLRLAIEEGLEEIYCDRACLELALANLLDNALKYTPTGGVVKLGATEGAESAVIWVEDSGPGIQPADRERIFERFYRGEGSDQLPGAGLGLAIVKSAIEAHGGQVRVVNGAGAKIAVEIPAAPALPDSDGGSAAPPEKGD